MEELLLTQTKKEVLRLFALVCSITTALFLLLVFIFFPGKSYDRSLADCNYLSGFFTKTFSTAKYNSLSDWTDEYSQVFEGLTENSDLNVYVFITDSDCNTVKSVFKQDNKGNVMFDSQKLKETVNEVTDNRIPFPQQYVRHAYNSSFSALTDKSGLRVGYCFIFVEGDYYYKGIAVLSIVVLYMLLIWGLTFMTVKWWTVRKYEIPISHICSIAEDIARGKIDSSFTVPQSCGLYDLGNTLNAMVKNLSSIENSRNDFLVSIAHDLRTPMTTIIGYIDCILEGAIPEEQFMYYLRLIKEEAVRVKDIVNATLEVTRIQSGERPLTLEWHDLRRIVNETVVGIYDRIQEKGINIQFDFPEASQACKVDRDAISRIIGYLLENALKYTPYGGNVGVSISNKCGYYTISIYNDGSGYKYSDQPYLFNKFYKVDKSRGLDKSDFGLDLYFCRAYAEAHGGFIELISEPDKYSEFYLVLPDKKEPEPKRIGKYERLFNRKLQRDIRRREAKLIRQQQRNLRNRF